MKVSFSDSIDASPLMEKKRSLPRSVIIQRAIGFYLFMTILKYGEGIED